MQTTFRHKKENDTRNGGVRDQQAFEVKKPRWAMNYVPHMNERISICYANSDKSIECNHDQGWTSQERDRPYNLLS